MFVDYNFIAYICTKTANGKEAPVARHGTAEVPLGTLKSIYRQLGL